MTDLLYSLYVDHGPKLAMYLFTLLAFLAARYVSRAAIVQRAIGEIGDAVREVNQTYVDGIKAGRLPTSLDGERLTPAEKAEAKARAIAIAKSNIGKKGLRRLARILGVDIEKWLDTKTESIVAAVKSAAPPDPR